MYTPEDVRRMIVEDYCWRKNALIDQGYEDDSVSIGQYGIESAMPKAKGSTGDKVGSIAIRNDKAYRMYWKHVEVVEFIDRYEMKVENDKNFNILNDFKKGMKKNKIQDKYKISQTNLDSRLNDIVNIYLTEQAKDYNKSKK